MPRKPIGPQRDIALSDDDWSWLATRARSLGITSRASLVRWLIAQDRQYATAHPTPYPTQDGGTVAAEKEPLMTTSPTPRAADGVDDADGRVRQLMAAAAEKRLRARLEKMAVRCEQLAAELRKLATAPVSTERPAAHVCADAQGAIMTAVEQLHLQLLTTDAYDIDTHLAIRASRNEIAGAGEGAGEGMTS